MTTELVKLTYKGPVATVVLNRPDKLNALNAEMLAALESYADELDRNREVRVVLLTGTGRAFCVGADIYEWSDLPPLEMGRRWIRDGHRIFARYARLPQPVIAVLNGYTFGGGLELALAADLRLAAEEVQLSFPEVKLGIIPGWGGTQRLPQLVGPSRAKQMIFSGDRALAEQAEQWGLVNEVVPADQLAERALELADSIAANGPVAVQMTKQLIDSAIPASGDNGVVLETLAGSLASYTADAEEGVSAFRQRRQPQFSGR
ncbi:MAG: enoyl-CoA hydratase/isomerase family protein [Caldilineaceae bacterium]|nr:enoyl-CoA hydratase/isomerase family protein [Caldilineaceae bacterium]MDE0338685.1 enoyl-CoA hydratase/isomerase family protein [Caldilineaceae bacterium]